MKKQKKISLENIRWYEMGKQNVQAKESIQRISLSCSDFQSFKGAFCIWSLRFPFAMNPFLFTRLAQLTVLYPLSVWCANIIFRTEAQSFKITKTTVILSRA